MNRRFAKWGLGGGAFLLLLLGTLFALRPAQNQCIPITDKAGLWSAFGLDFYVPIIAPVTRGQIDPDDQGGSYYVNREYLETRARHIYEIVGGAEHGLLYPETDFGTYGESHFDGFGFRYEGLTPNNSQNVIGDQGLMWFGEPLFDDDEWTEGLVFSAYSNPIDWRTLLGFCPTYYQVAANLGLSGLHRVCNFKFVWNGLLIDYNILAAQAHRYREVEDFLKQHVICDVVSISADQS